MAGYERRLRIRDESRRDLHPFGFFARILVILKVASMLLMKSEARRNILMGMLLGAMSADGIWDQLELNVFFYSLEYLAFVGMVATAVVPTFVALVEVGRLARQQEHSAGVG